jgi:hypothetical protein
MKELIVTKELVMTKGVLLIKLYLIAIAFQNQE